MKNMLTCSKCFINFTEHKQTSLLCGYATISKNHHLSQSLLKHIVVA